jgi:hypothetical protein
LQPDQSHYTWRNRSLAALRTILLLHALAVMAQAVFAGEFLSGLDAPVVFHAWTGWFVLGLSLAQIAAAIGMNRFGGPLWLVVSSIFVCLAEALQVGTGYGRFLGVHIPLGVFVFGAVVWQALWAFRKQGPV